jgi:nitroreductase
MEFLEVVGTRRSVRWFKSWEPVSRAQVQEILEVVRHTTCPGNLQPWRAIVVYRDELDDETRDLLLAAGNWQGGQVQSPVWIYWYADEEAAYPQEFATNTHLLCDVGALPAAYGWSKQRIDEAIFKAMEAPEGMFSINEMLHELPRETSAVLAHAETVGATAVACLAAVNAGLATCLHVISKGSKQDEVNKALGVPSTFIPVWVQLVGYPAETMEAGGQRPRFDFEKLYCEGKWGNPMRRDPEVVKRMEEAKLIQAQAPLPNRFEELKFLARMYGYPEVTED